MYLYSSLLFKIPDEIYTGTINKCSCSSYCALTFVKLIHNNGDTNKDRLEIGFFEQYSYLVFLSSSIIIVPAVDLLVMEFIQVRTNTIFAAKHWSMAAFIF